MFRFERHDLFSGNNHHRPAAVRTGNILTHYVVSQKTELVRLSVYFGPLINHVAYAPSVNCLQQNEPVNNTHLGTQPEYSQSNQV